MLNESMNHNRSKNFPVTFEREIARLLPHLERSSFFIVAVCYGLMLWYSTLPPAFGVELGELDDKILATDLRILPVIVFSLEAFLFFED